jgi:hypothetical protein
MEGAGCATTTRNDALDEVEAESHQPGELASVPLAILAAVVLLTDWIEWPWWIGLGLGSPLGLLFLFDDRFGDALFDGDGVLGDADGGGDLGGGGDGGG